MDSMDSCKRRTTSCGVGENQNLADLPEEEFVEKKKKKFSDKENRINASLALRDLYKLYTDDPETFEERLDSAVEGLLDHGPPPDMENSELYPEFAFFDPTTDDDDNDATREKRNLVNFARSMNSTLLKKQKFRGKARHIGHIGVLYQGLVFSFFVCLFWFLINSMISHAWVSEGKCWSVKSNANLCRNPLCGCSGPFLGYFWCKRKCSN